MPLAHRKRKLSLLKRAIMGVLISHLSESRFRAIELQNNSFERMVNDSNGTNHSADTIYPGSHQVIEHHILKVILVVRWIDPNGIQNNEQKHLGLNRYWQVAQERSDKFAGVAFF